MPKEDTQFSKDNQPKGRGKGKKSLMLDAIKSVCGSEEEFLKQVVVIGMGGLTKISAPDDEEEEFEYKQPNTMLLNLVLNRIEPPLKATSPLVEFEFTKDAKPHEQAVQVLSAVSEGKISADIGHMFVTSISSMLKIQEVTDIDERLKKMEEQVDSTE